MRKRKRVTVGDHVVLFDTKEVARIEGIDRDRDWLIVRKDGSQGHYRDDEVQPLAMATDPLIKAAQSAYRKSLTKRLDDLRAEESRWKRKLTIASNKLADVRKELDTMLTEAVRQIDGLDPKTGNVPERKGGSNDTAASR